MFDDRDPLLARVRRSALAMPGAAEKVSHGRPAFFTGKVFAYFGGSLRVDGECVDHAASILVLLDDDDRLAMLERGAWVPGYLGPSGWIGIDLADVDDAEIDELLDASYRRTAPARLVRELDAR